MLQSWFQTTLVHVVCMFCRFAESVESVSPNFGFQRSTLERKFRSASCAHNTNCPQRNSSLRLWSWAARHVKYDVRVISIDSQDLIRTVQDGPRSIVKEARDSCDIIAAKKLQGHMQRLGSESCCSSSAIWNTNDGRSSRNGHRILCVLGHFWALDTILCVWEIIVSIAENESGTGLLHSHSREEGPRDIEGGRPKRCCNIFQLEMERNRNIATSQANPLSLCSAAPSGCHLWQSHEFLRGQEMSCFCNSILIPLEQFLCRITGVFLDQAFTSTRFKYAWILCFTTLHPTLMIGLPHTIRQHLFKKRGPQPVLINQPLSYR